MAQRSHQPASSISDTAACDGESRQSHRADAAVEVPASRRNPSTLCCLAGHRRRHEGRGLRLKSNGDLPALDHPRPQPGTALLAEFVGESKLILETQGLPFLDHFNDLVRTSSH